MADIRTRAFALVSDAKHARLKQEVAAMDERPIPLARYFEPKPIDVDPIRLYGSFAARANALKNAADELERSIRIASVYVRDTGRAQGRGDFDLLFAADACELAGRRLRILFERIQQMRADLKAEAAE